MPLQPGDLLLFRVGPEAPLLDRLIGWGESKIGDKTPQGNQYYHVAFVSDDVHLMFSSQPPKIDLYPIPDPLPSYVEIYRTIMPLSQIQLIKIFQYAESRRGKWYDFVGVLSFGKVELGDLEFCSRYTEDTFACAGIVLSPDVLFPTPDDIADSLVIYKVAS